MVTLHLLTQHSRFHFFELDRVEVGIHVQHHAFVLLHLLHVILQLLDPGELLEDLGLALLIQPLLLLDL